MPNSAGGFGFAVDDWSRLHRFLVLGSENGTYYASARQLTADNARVVFRLAAEDGVRLVERVVVVSEAGRAPKPEPALFALAVAASIGQPATKAAALGALVRVARTGTHLFTWAGYVQGMRGWGPSLRKAVAAWYARDPDAVAYSAVKYRSRAGWSHRDLLRLAHPKPATPTHDALFRWIARGEAPESGNLPMVDAFLAVNEPGVDEARAAELVRSARLPWEALPDRLLNSSVVWDALLESVGATALLRQLPRLTRIGLVGPTAPLDPRIAKLSDPGRLRAARVHPVAVLLALHSYRSGRSRGGVTWTPAGRVVDLLDAAFYAAFGAVEPAGKRTLVSVDVSRSMRYPFSRPMTGVPQLAMGDLAMSDAAAALAMVTVRAEPECAVGAFATEFTLLPVTARQRLDDVTGLFSRLPFGGTDCA